MSLTEAAVTSLLTFVGLAVLNYLIGSIPFSYFIAKLKGIDLRDVGSGNVGATNVARSVGLIYGVVALLLDILKGFGAALLTLQLSQPVYLAGLAVLGHNWSIFLGFKSGKGVATTLGILLAISWQVFLIAIGIWVVITAITRYVSIASVIALASVPLWLYLLGAEIDYIALMGLLATMSLIQHRENFRKLATGEENKLG